MIDMTLDEITDLLDQTLIGRLCMANAEGRPYAIPLPFCWTGTALYLRLPLTGRKGEILRQNDLVCFEVDTCTDTLDDYASVLIEGRLVEVNAVEEKQLVCRQNDEKYARLRRGYRPGHGRSKPVTELPMRKILVDRISGRKKTPNPMPATVA